MPLTKQAQAFVETLAFAKPPAWYELPVEEARDTFRGFVDIFGAAPDILRIEDRVLDNGIRLRIYADVENPAPAVMYFHGGGWVLGDIETHDALCRRLAKHSRCVIVSVDYGCSPESPFPGPFNDCVDATAYVAENAERIGAIPNRLAVMGDSAGGNLAAAVAMHSRDNGGPKIAYQVLVYPVIEPTFDTDSYQDFAEGFGLTRKTMKWFWEQYLGDQAASVFSAPSMASSLEGLPPAHVVTAEYDVLRDEGEQFAERLRAANVPTTSVRYDGNLHGFIHFAGAFDDGLHATKEIAQVLQRQLVS